MNDKRRLEDLEIYNISISLSEKAWDIYKKLPKNIKYHIGNQFLDSTDSIGSNISEGFGRYHFKDCIKFYYNSRGSLFETKYWINLLFKRDLININDKYYFDELLNKMGSKLNSFINQIKSKV